MGQVATKICGGLNPLQLLLKEYGDDIGKFIAIEKAKILIEQKFSELRKMLTGETSVVKEQLFNEVGEKEKFLDEKFKAVKDKLDSIIPGGVSSLEQMKGEPIEDILGYNEFKSKFQDIKQNAEDKFGEEEESIWKTLEDNKTAQTQKLEQARPKLPLYDDLPSKQQAQVFKEGEKHFQRQIREQEETIMTEIEDQLNPQNYLGKYKDLIPSGSLDGLLGSAISKFDSVAQALSGGGLSDLADQFF